MQTLRQRAMSVARSVMHIAMIWVALGTIADSARAQTTTTPIERFVLSGVVFAGEGRGLAWLQEPTFTNNYVITVRPGDSVGPYRVMKILEDQVVLAGPGGTVAIPLAGVRGTATTAAASPEAAPSPGGHQSLSKPEAIVIPRGDARRSFPASDFLIGAGAQTTGPAANQVWKPVASNSRSVSPVRGAASPAGTDTTSPGALPGSNQRSQEGMVIPHGDPRRSVPASDFLFGAR